MKNGEESGRRKMTSSLVGTLSLFFWIRLCLQLYILYKFTVLQSLIYRKFGMSSIRNHVNSISSMCLWVSTAPSSNLLTQQRSCLLWFWYPYPVGCSKWNQHWCFFKSMGLRQKDYGPILPHSDCACWQHEGPCTALHCTCTLCNLMIWFWLVVQSIVVKLSWTT